MWSASPQLSITQVTFGAGGDGGHQATQRRPFQQLRQKTVVAWTKIMVEAYRNGMFNTYSVSK